MPGKRKGRRLRLIVSAAMSSIIMQTVAAVPAEASGPSLTLLSFNMCGNVCGIGLGVAQATVRSIQNRSPQPAVVMLQEVCETQYVHLTKALGGYRGKFVPTDDRLRCEDHSKYGIAVLMRTTTKPTVLGDWPLPDSGGHREKRRVMCLQSNSFGGSQPLVACNTHITTDKSDRTAQIKAVADKAKSYNAENRVVVGGDFNAKPHTGEMDVMYNTTYSPAGTGTFAEVDLPYRGDRASGGGGSEFNEYTSCPKLPKLHLVCNGTRFHSPNKKFDYIFLANGDWANYHADATKSTSSDHMLLWAWASIS